MSVWQRLDPRRAARRLRRGRRPGGVAEGREARGAGRAYLTQWAREHRGVEAYVEPATSMTAITVVLIATDGEWTRRAVPSKDAAFEFARSLSMPVYDVLQTGYPARMRQWSSQHRSTIP